MPSRIDIAVVPSSSDDARWCLERYYETLDELFEDGFELGRSLVPDAGAFTPPTGTFLVATMDGSPVGCGGVKLEEPGVGYIKRMWVDPDVRGRGLGRRILEALEGAARDLGCRVVQLETNGALRAAIAMYRSAGYDEVEAFNDEPYAHHWFRKRLTPQEPPMDPSELPPVPAETVVGHVHLKVADVDRAIEFYSGVLGFPVTQRMGRSAAFLGAGGYHHHIGLNSWESAGGTPPPPGTTGLYHVAFLYPSRAALGRALQRLRDHGVPLEGAADHGVSEALYLRDPDGNGVELYRDRPRDEWPVLDDGSLAMFTHPLDLAALLKAADE